MAGACSDEAGEVTAGSTTGAGGPSASGADLGTIAHGKLTTCTDVPNPPFEFETNGVFDGIDIELVRAIADRLSLETEFKDVDFDGIFSALDAGQCDIVASSVVITDERMRTLDFSDGYFRVYQSLLVREGDEARYDELDKLSGRTIGVQSGTTGADYARENAAGATIREFPGADDLLTALDAGRVDAALHDLPVNAHHAESTGQTVVAKTFTEGDGEEFGLVLRKGQTELKVAIDGALAKVKADDTFPTILRRFLGDTAGQS